MKLGKAVRGVPEPIGINIKTGIDPYSSSYWKVKSDYIPPSILTLPVAPVMQFAPMPVFRPIMPEIFIW
jgi:hypothetical protein